MRFLSRQVVVFLLLLSAGIVLGQRNVVNFNEGWSFHLGDVAGAEQEDFDASSWRVLNVPHDWSIEQNYTTIKTAGSTGFLPAGIGWYRKTFELKAKELSKVTHIEFDGVYCNSEVWINGHYLGIRPYGYIPFSYDLSKYLKAGKNVLAVKVDHSNYADTRWYSGSGIYRPVRLVQSHPIHVPQWGAWVETSQVSSSAATVKVFAVVKNSSNVAEKLSVKTKLIDENGLAVASKKARILVSKQDTVELTLQVKNPKLWSLENTNMYTAKVEILKGKEVLDTYAADFGMRSIRFDANKGFFLNGKNMKMKGVCLHHDAGAVGAVFITDVWERRLATLKEIGVNAIRMSHNPADPGLLRLCDEMGFLVINEAFDEWRRNKGKWITSRFAGDMLPELETGYGDIYEEWAERDAKDMVRYSRHHPSIIMWSMGNEIEWTYPYYFKMEKSNQGLGNQVLVEETGDSIDELKETAVEIMAWIKEVDQTRPVTTGGVLPKAGNTTGYFDVPDVMGYNYRAAHYDDDHAAYPERVIYGSENWGKYQEWKDVKERDFVSGLFLWTGIAYLGESGPFPWKGLDISLLDFAGFYTPRGHFFRTLWNDEPYTYLATKHAKKAQWIYKNGEWVDNRVRFWLDKWLFEDVEEKWSYAKGDSVFVEVFSNAPEVELFINGKSYGVKSPENFEDHIVKYLVPYKAGEITAVGLVGTQKTSEYTIQTPNKWSGLQLKLQADKVEMNANGEDVVHITASILDGKGVLMPENEMQIFFQVEGEGQNIAVDNGWDRNVQPHKANSIVTHNGKALMLVQSTKTAGTIRVTAKVGKAVSNEVMIQTK